MNYLEINTKHVVKAIIFTSRNNKDLLVKKNDVSVELKSINKTDITEIYVSKKKLQQIKNNHVDTIKAEAFYHSRKPKSR